MIASTERIIDPTIETDWDRVAIMEVIEHWRKHARDNGIWKRAKKLTRRMLWLLPESRSGEPIVNPLGGKPVTRPKHPWSLAVTRRECELLDRQCCEIWDRYCPAGRIGKQRECVVCLGNGWMPAVFEASRVCRFCSGRGVTE